MHLKLFRSVIWFGLLGCNASTGNMQADSFKLCDAESPARKALSLDYSSKLWLMVDVGAVAKGCSSTATACLSSPLPFARPPRLPEGAETISWSNGPIDFRITRKGGDSYALTSSAGDREYLYDYSIAQGITGLQISDRNSNYKESWVRCRGALRFEDIPRLL
jgi:hypothetical protein